MSPNVQTSFYLPPALLEELKIEAIRRGIRMSELIRQAVRKELDSGNPN